VNGRTAIAHRVVGYAAYLAAVGIISIVTCAATVTVSDMGTKRLAGVVLAALVAVTAVVTRQPKRVFLFAWILALTYNRQYFSFDAVLGDNGPQGLYWIPADPFFAVLLLLWACRLTTSRRFPPITGRALWPWITPFLAACALSTVFADRIQWGGFEFVRIIKFALIIAYVRYNFGRAEWWTCVAALACAVMLQSTLSILQTTLNVGSHLGALFGRSEVDVGVTLELMGRRQHRGAGTMAHPNFLGPYLLLVIPMFVSLALTARQASLRIVCAIVATVGLAGVACTLSRLPWVVTVLEICLVLIALTWLRLVKARFSLGLVAVGGFVFLLALVPFAGVIEQRVHSDLRDSYKFRIRYNHAAMQMWSESPYFGVGLNNFRLHLADYAPDLEALQVKGDSARTKYNLRTIAPVHNLYLLVLCETGIVGLAGFIVLVFGVLRIGLSASRTTESACAAACCGLLVGIFGQLLQQTMDFSLWIDPAWYTFALIIALLGTAPSLFPAVVQEPARLEEGE